MNLVVEPDPFIPKVIATCLVNYKEKELLYKVKAVLTKYRKEVDYYSDTLRDGGSLELLIINSSLLKEVQLLK